MKHHNAIRKFGRTADQRQALIRSLACSLIIKEKIRTTEAKAKELRPYIEKMVTRGRKGDVFSRRLLVSRLGNESATKKLVEKIAPRYKERTGGYTRIVKLTPRQGDASKMAIIEFV
ncbi:MAG: 50S ribosomal protein L17 [bacterium]|nr:50S ribosomal protein L17 [bacterium]